MFEVDTQELVKTARRLDEIAGSLNSLEYKLRNAASSNSIRTKSYRGISSTMYGVAGSYAKSVANMHSLAGGIRSISTMYSQTERDVTSFAQQVGLGKPLQGKANIGKRGSGSSDYGSKSHDDSGYSGSGASRSFADDSDASDTKKDPVEDLISWMLKIYSKTATNKDSGNAAGSFNDFLGYVDNLMAFFGKDGWEKGGISEILDLAEGSVEMWKGWYKGFLDAYGIKNKSGGLGIFSLEGQHIVGVLPIVASIFGVGSSFYEVAVSGSYTSDADLLNNILTTFTSDGVDLASKTYNAITNTEGIYTPASLWATFGKTILATGGQTYKSIEKYSADGDWTTLDTAATGIELGVSGLYAMADSLSFGALEATGVKADDISSAIEDWGENAGKWLAKKSIEGGWSWVFKLVP